MERCSVRVILLLLTVALGGNATGAAEEAPGLPRQMTWSAYGTTSAGYVQAIAISNTLRKLYNASVRVIPGKNDISRFMPLAQKTAQHCACGIAELYFAQEGIGIFAARKWGPQRMRISFTNRGDGIGHGLVMAGDLGIRTLADLKGRRVAWVRGSPALQVGTTGILAFAGLTWDDVERVDVPGYQQGLDALLNGAVDAAWSSTPASHVQRIAGSPRGALWPVYPHDDEAAWARMRAIAPHFRKTMVTEGLGLEHNTSGQVPFPGIGVPYPVFASYDTVPEPHVYGLTRAVMANVVDFQNAAPGMETFAPDKQDFRLVLPYHPGAIRYFRETGRWTEEDERYNATLLRRQEVLATAWQEMLATDVDDKGFESAWSTLRTRRLTEAGLDADPSKTASASASGTP